MLPFSDLDLLRLQQIIGMPTPSPTVGDDPAVQDIVSRNYHPQTAANDRLNQLLNQFPQRPTPSTMDKVRGNIAYFGSSSPTSHWGGVPVGFHINSRDAEESKDEAMYGNFNRSKEDWSDQIKPVEYAANQERYANTNDRQAVEQSARTAVAKQRADETARANLSKEAIAQRRLDIYEKLAHDRGAKIVVDTTGNSYMVHTDGTKESIDLKQFTPADLIKLRTEGRLQEIGAQGSEQRKNIGARGEQERQNIDERGEQGRIPNPNKASSGAKPQTESQIAVGVQNRLAQALAEHPEWSKYIVQDGNKYGLKMPSGFLGMGGGDEKVYHEIYNKIYGASTKPASPETAQPVENKKGADIADKRRRAIKILQDAGELVVDENINHVMEQMK